MGRGLLCGYYLCVYRLAVSPPSTIRCVPVTCVRVIPIAYMASAISFVVASLFRVDCCFRSSQWFSWCAHCSIVRGVGVVPGSIALTRIPRFPNGSESVVAKLIKPALAAEYAGSPYPCIAFIEDMNVIERSPLVCLRFGRNASSVLYVPVRFSSSEFWNISRLGSSVAFGIVVSPGYARPAIVIR